MVPPYHYSPINSLRVPSNQPSLAMSSQNLEQMDLTNYDEVKDADYAPGDSIDAEYDW